MYPAMAVVALTLSVTPGQTTPNPTWLNDYKVAQMRVADSGKPMVVVMGSGPAGLQDVVREGGADPAMSRMLADKFVCMYVDTTTPKGREMAAAFQVGERGVVISDRAGTSQAFSASGQLGRSEMMAALERHSNGQAVSYTETAGPMTTTPGTIVLAGGQVQAGTVYQAGGAPMAGTVVNAGGGCGTPGMVMQAQGVAIGGQGYAPGSCGTPAYGHGGGYGAPAYGHGGGCGKGGFGLGFGGGCCGKGMGVGFGGGCGQPVHASGCGAPAAVGHAPMMAAPAPCPTAYAPQAGYGHGGHGGGCGKGGFGFGGGFGGGCCFGGGWGGGFGGGFGGGCCK